MRGNIMRRIIRKPEVIKITGKSGVTIWRDEKAGRFPKRVRIGSNSMGWFEDEILEWLESRPRGMVDKNQHA